MIETPYLLFLGEAPDGLAAKVAQGIRDWRPENAVGQFRMEGCKADMKLPDMTLAENFEAQFLRNLSFRVPTSVIVNTNA